MSYNISDNRGTIQEPITYRDTSNLTVQNIAEIMREGTKNNGIPANVREDTVHEGGCLGKSYSCVVISHPNPPQKYFDDVIVVIGNTVYFYFFGYSKANYKTNRAQQREESIGGMILNRIQGSSELSLNQEADWHANVMAVFNSYNS